MRSDDEESSSTKKIEHPKGSSWIHRAFNPPHYDQARKRESEPSYSHLFRPGPPARIGDAAKLFRSPASTKKALSMVVGDKTAGSLVDVLESIHAQNGETLRRAALSNWFIQPETPIPFINTLTTCVDDEAAVQDAFVVMIRAQIESIRDRLKKDFPLRAEILKEGFALHTEQRYFASIPLFLMMAEGIALEKTGKSIFNAGSGKEKGQTPPKIFDWLNRNNLSPAAKIYSGALQTEHPFSRSSKKGHLSRHAVLHGNSTDYGKEIFSLQAISILGLVGWVFSEDGLVFTDRGDETQDPHIAGNIERS